MRLHCKGKDLIKSVDKITRGQGQSLVRLELWHPISVNCWLMSNSTQEIANTEETNAMSRTICL